MNRITRAFSTSGRVGTRERRGGHRPRLLRRSVSCVAHARFWTMQHIQPLQVGGASAPQERQRTLQAWAAAVRAHRECLYLKAVGAHARRQNAYAAGSSAAAAGAEPGVMPSSAFTCRASWDFLRPAVFLWTMLRLTFLSMIWKALESSGAATV